MDSVHPLPLTLACQIASLSSLPFWFPFWKTAALQEKTVISSHFNVSFRNLLKHQPRKLYEGMGLTVPMQCMYPTCSLLSYELRKHGLFTILQSEIVVGAAVSPLCACWKTIVLSDMTITQTVRRHTVSELFRAVPAWMLRNSIVWPCLSNGSQHVRSFVPKHNQEQHPYGTRFLEIFLPALVATVVSHPADLITGMLNGDPSKRYFKSCLDAYQKLIAARGYRGVFVAYPHRFMAMTIETTMFPYIRDWLYCQ
jgi:hypothetical protein